MALFAAILSLILAANTLAFPQYEALVQRELEEITSRSNAAWPPSPPGPLNDTSAKLVNDRAHPFKAARPGIDMRGPCPGLNTLASHGYLPRNGIATPAQIINAVQEGFNMGNDLAVFVTYAAFLVDGNPLTNLMSIGGKSIFTGPDPPRPAIVGGLDTHAVFEGDASMTRGDAFFGDNHSFNETQFDEFVKFSNQFGGGKYNIQAATEFRWQRIQESIATNPNFSFISPRYFTAYAESTFPLFFFVDGRQADGQLSLDVARGFFQESRMPDGFFRANTSVGLDAVGNAIGVIFEAHPIAPGGNQGRVNSYTVDPNSADFTQFCKLYTDFVNITVKSLYPNPKGLLRTALNANLGFFFSPLQGSGCPQVFPFGQ